MTETDEGRQLENALRESATLSADFASTVRKQVANLDSDTRQSIEALLGEIEDAAADVLALKDHIPQMEAETHHIERARAEQEARGEQVPERGAPGYAEWEAAQFHA